MTVITRFENICDCLKYLGAHYKRYSNLIEMMLEKKQPRVPAECACMCVSMCA